VTPHLAIIIPVFNEQDNILPLANEVAAAMQSVSDSWQLIFVDDASTDATWGRIETARQSDPRVTGLRHGRNAGQSAAVWTGIQHSNSPRLATLDGDRQNDPAEIPRMLAMLDEVDFVCGDRSAARRDSWVRRTSSVIARWCRVKALGHDFRDTGCALRVFKRECLTGVFAFNGLHRFLPILVAGGGWKTREVPVRHRARVAGVSKYGVWNRLGRGLFDLVGMAWFQQRRLPAVPVSPLTAPGGNKTSEPSQ
jgi:dolichol-phosphate mannosyltransferase